LYAFLRESSAAAEQRSSGVIKKSRKMEEEVIVLDQETGEEIEMNKFAFENLVFYDETGRYLVI